MKKNLKVTPAGGQGFTLIELLIVIGIIAIIASVVFVSLDPLTRFADARDANRWRDAMAILDAIKIDQVDNGGGYSATVYAMTTTTPYMIGNSTFNTCNTCKATSTDIECVDLAEYVSQGYLPKVPHDPQTGSDSKTDYFATKMGNGSVVIGACDPENTSEIYLMR
jgi:prepilin-type N-terminal cleavage/methylation domain-containing protein